jgi:hypothetical protein
MLGPLLNIEFLSLRRFKPMVEFRFNRLYDDIVLNEHYFVSKNIGHLDQEKIKHRVLLPGVQTKANLWASGGKNGARTPCVGRTKGVVRGQEWTRWVVTAYLSAQISKIPCDFVYLQIKPLSPMWSGIEVLGMSATIDGQRCVTITLDLQHTQVGD